MLEPFDNAAINASWTRPFWVVYKKKKMLQYSEDSDVRHYLFSLLDWLGESPPAGTPGAHRSAKPGSALLIASGSLSLSGSQSSLLASGGIPRASVCVCIPVQSLNCVGLFTTPRTVARRAPLSMGFSRQEYWSGLPFPTPGALPFSEMKPASPALASGFFPTEPPTRLKLRTLREIAVHLS